MQLTVHRGTHEIGGSCVEIRTERTKVLIDLGLPLDNDKLPKERQIEIRGKAREWCRNADAIFISHYHADHYALLTECEKTTPIYMSVGTAAMLRVNSVVNPKVNHPSNIRIAERKGNGNLFLPIEVGDICITPYTVDHAAFDACAFLIEADGKRILYSGDIRTHGVKGLLYRYLPKGVDYLMLEGTNLSTCKCCVTEQEVCEAMTKQFLAEKDKLYCIWCSGQNIDRLVQIYKAAKNSGRKLIVDTYVAYVLEAAHAVRETIPSPLHPIEGHDVFRHFVSKNYIDRIAEKESPEIAELYKLLPQMDARNVGRNPGNYVWIVRPSLLPILKKYKHTPMVIVTSLWRGYEKEESRFMEWIEEHGYDNPYIHTSGHADVDSLQRIVWTLDPQCLIPIHTEAPERFADVYPDRNILFLRDSKPMRL